jgi:hypothetical protein
MATIKKKNEFAGVGALIQLLGLASPFVLGVVGGLPGIVVGLILMVILFGVGSAKSQKLYCSDCGNPVADKNVKMCAVCKAEF